MNQGQFTTLDALICSRIGVSDQKELAILAALAIGLAQTLGGLTAIADARTTGLGIGVKTCQLMRLLPYRQA